MPNITIDPIGGGSGNPFFYNWNCPNINLSQIQNANANSVSDVYRLKSVILTNTDLIYDGYKVYLTNPEAEEWLNISGETSPTTITQVRQSLNLTFTAQNYQSILPGNYETAITLSIYGTRISNGVLEFIESKSFTVNLNLAASSDDVFNFTPTYLALNHIKDSILYDDGDLDIVTVGDYTILENNYLLTNGVAGDVALNGTQLVTLTLRPSADDLPLGSNLFQLQIQRQNGVINTYPITIILTENAFTITPPNLNFDAVFQISEAAAQPIEIYTDGYPFTIVSQPNWLEIEDTNEEFRKEIKPFITSNLSIGSYAGVIEIESNGITKQVNVTYEIQGYISILPKPIYFTHDLDYLFFTTQMEQTFVKLNILIGIPDFNGAIKTINRELKVAFFRGKAKIHLGNEIHNLIQSKKENIYENLNLYANPKATTLDIYFQEISKVTNESVRSETLSRLFFQKGRKPKTWNENIGILSHDSEMIRVTKNSIISASFLKNLTDTQDLNLKKNDSIIESTLVPISETNIFTFVKKVSEIEDIEIGDTLTFEYEDIEKSYLIIPEEFQSTNIYFETEWDTIDVFEFIGSFSTKKDFERLTFKNYSLFKNKLQILKTITGSKFNINTGWIFESNVNIINQILGSSKVWAILEDGSKLNLRPISKSLTEIDSDKQLYAYDLEFQINQEYD